MTARVLFVGWDAMDADLAWRWADKEHMPNLARLRAAGLSGQTINPDGFYVGALWASFATAVGPGTHGRYAWAQFDLDTYTHPDAPEEDGDATPFWRTLDAAGLRCAVVDMPHSIVYPDFGGLFVKDWLVHDGLPSGMRTLPAELAETLVATYGSDPMTGSCNAFPRRSASDYRRFVDVLRERAERKTAFLCDAIEREPWDLVTTVYGESHCAAHQLWHVHSTSNPEHDPELAAAIGDPLRDVYAHLDDQLGQLLDAAGPDTCVVVLMSHGLCDHFDGDHLVDEVIDRIQRTIPLGRSRTLGERLSLLRGTHHRPKRGWRGLVKRWPAYAFRKAFRDYNNEAFAAVRLNLVGRDPLGIIRPGQELDAFLDQMTDEMMACRNGATGAPVFTRVVRTDDITQGPRRRLLPDLLFEWAKTAPIESIESPRIGRVEGPPYTNRTGDHRNIGCFVAIGPGVESGRLDGVTRIEDIAPTLAARLGVTLNGVEGRPIPGMEKCPALDGAGRN